jgi:hypothetical protein
MADEATEPASNIDVDYDQECFFITPIGKPDSDERKRSNGVRDAVVRPVAVELGLKAVRADEIERGGHITLQVLEHCVNAKVAVADLTGQNLNVFYEVGLRHAVRQALVLIADESERGQLPFDLLQQRTIFYTNDFAGAAECREKVAEQLRSALAGHVDSPVQAAETVRAFQQGDAVQRTLAELVTKVEDLGLRVSRASRERINPATARHLYNSLSQLARLAAERNDPDLERLVGDLEMPVQYIVRRTPMSAVRGAVESEIGRETRGPDLLAARGARLAADGGADAAERAGIDAESEVAAEPTSDGDEADSPAE